MSPIDQGIVSSKILDGKFLADLVHAEISREVGLSQAGSGKVPGLGVILVGDNPASHKYVATKEKVAKKCGFLTEEIRLPSSASFQDVKSAISTFNQSPRIHGILLQLPLPEGLKNRTNEVLDLIEPGKDADGLHPLNQGKLARGDGKLVPCTPLGLMRLIDLAVSPIKKVANLSELPKADLSGKLAIVVGRSVLVGEPAAALLLERNATVIVAHSRTKNLDKVCASADILVAAVGKPRFVKGNWIKSGAIVIDVGINALDGKLVGDVDFESAVEQAGAITPVPGGVGPMTVAMLMQNTFTAFKLIEGLG